MKKQDAGSARHQKKKSQRGNVSKIVEREGVPKDKQYKYAVIVRNVTTVRVHKNNKVYTAICTGEPRIPPSVLSLEKNYELTALFLNQIRHSLTENWRASHRRINRKVRRRQTSELFVKSYHDYSKIELLSPTVALMIAAEYDRISKRGGWLPGAIDVDKWNSDVRLMMEGVGFFQILKIAKRSYAKFENDDYVILPFRSGLAAAGQTVQSLFDDLGLSNIIDEPLLYGAVVEALVNTRQHAYPSQIFFPEPHFPGWWLGGFLDRKAGRVRVMAFDQGYGIPGTITFWSRYGAFRRLWEETFGSTPNSADTSQDGQAISIAMEVGRSSTNQEYRGRGLPAMEAVLDLCRDGAVAVYSRCGQYVKKKGKPPSVQSNANAIGGTLIMWDLIF